MDALILLLPIALLLFLILRGRKQQRSVSDLQASLAVGQRVMTASGLYGTVVDVTDTTVDLEPSPGVRLTWARAAVARVVDEPSTTSPTEPEALPPVSGGTAPGAAGTADEAPERHDR
ncbi:preprotein translocase subunit YajC [Quadrisphaera oryzae]|uniref:preprotein translocase subunit YajC n=1 Tax=Quadrisphaera TaxID=317661 RepID=UPI001647010F|nr:preprotein translocase subunit YajC [Quadrisphaera sp. RL12-1S]MBC3761929.1 preprotein translocase subunit YajC [Quadrisphaera sp. RL12-1S]